MKSNLNLLPEQFGRRIILRNSLILWACLFVVVCSTLVALAYRQHDGLSAEQERLDVIDKQCLPVQEMLQENVKIGRRIEELHGRQTLLARLDRGGHPLQLVGLVSRSAQYVGEGLKVSDMSYRITETVVPVDPQQQPQDKEKPPAVIESIRLSLSGLAANDLAVSKFILMLRDSGYFSSVELKSSVRSEFATGRARSFQVDCTL